MILIMISMRLISSVLLISVLPMSVVLFPGDMSFEELEFNQVADPTVLLPKSDDVFDRLRKAQYVREQLSQAPDSDAKDLAESVVEKTDSVTYN